ncbi:MAG: helix-turn-helix transcriptional regulator [Lewinellaceae bacterium]|nr:helix-turn-helix transcriptional regulator [Lewinellaceae bacterium]MCB9288242.1 helix-turn-helix transcriptional regulator [Lewinellaceae bacterium]
MPSKIFESAINNVKPEHEAFIRMSVDISKRIQELMEVKGMKQNELAEALGKSPSEVSKWLSGMHNFTLKSIGKLEVILGAPILVKATDHPINEKELRMRISSLKKELEQLEILATRPA